jgi:catechol 2,3-dioxygenase-like lactoylglutathione lyase family enzyme
MAQGDEPFFQSAVPMFSVDDLKAAMAYYQEKLGFQVAWTWEDPPLAGMCRDEVELQLALRGVVGPPGPSNVYFRIKGVDAYCDLAKRNGAEVTVMPGDRPYGMRDFAIRDPSGNELVLGEETASR